MKWECENELCEGLASSTAYASKLNLDIFDSLFGATGGKEENGLSLVRLRNTVMGRRRLTRKVLVHLPIVLRDLHDPPDGAQPLLGRVRILVQARQPPSLPIAPQRKPEHLLDRRVPAHAERHRLARGLARVREEHGGGHRRRGRDAPARDGGVQVRERVRRVGRRHHAAQRRLGTRAQRRQRRYLLPREKVFLCRRPV